MSELKVYEGIPSLNEFVESSKIRVASIMKQLVNVIVKQEKQTNIQQQLNKDDFYLVTTLVNLINAEIVMYCATKVISVNTFQKYKDYIKFISDRYGLDVGHNLYRLHIVDHKFKIELNKQFLHDYSTYNNDIILDIMNNWNSLNQNKINHD